MAGGGAHGGISSSQSGRGGSLIVVRRASMACSDSVSTECNATNIASPHLPARLEAADASIYQSRLSCRVPEFVSTGSACPALAFRCGLSGPSQVG